MAAAAITLVPIRIPWPLLALGGAGVVLVLVGWFYWSATRTFRQQARDLSGTVSELRSNNAELADSVAVLEAERRALAADVAMLRSTTDSLTDQLASVRSIERELTEQLDQLRSSVTELDEDRAKYEYAVRIMADRSRRPVVHAEHHIVYMIGEDQSGDIVTETYRTAAKSASDALLWHDVTVGLTNQSSKVQSFRELDQTSVFEVLPNPPPAVKPLEYLPTGFRDNRVGVLIFFEPEIGTTPREWRLTYCWRGMWDPLRNRHRDTSILRLAEGHRVERRLVTVSFVFPLSAVSPRVRTGPGTPRLDPEWGADLKGRPLARFSIPNPAFEAYDWVLEVDAINTRNSH